jgi:hypothetical protein
LPLSFVDPETLQTRGQGGRLDVEQFGGATGTEYLAVGIRGMELIARRSDALRVLTSRLASGVAFNTLENGFSSRS